MNKKKVEENVELKPRILSISKRIAFMYTAFVLVTLILFNVVLQTAIFYISMHDVEAEIKSNADAIEDYLKYENSLVLDSFNGIKLGYNIYFNVLNENKRIIYTNNNDLPFLAVNDDSKMQVFNSKKQNNAKDVVLSYINKKIILDGRVYYIQVARSIESFKQYFLVFARALGFTCIIGIFIFFYSGSYLTKRVLKPIRNISAIAKEITSKSLNKRIILDGPHDEIKELTVIFNSMIERLESDFERQKRFISDASHELRTPLAVIHGHVNMLNRWGKNDPEVLANSLETLEAETKSMNKLIEKLLYLAKNDNNSIIMNFESFDLYVLLKEVTDEAIMMHEDYNISFICEKGHMINADYNALKQVFRNLIDNGIKFSSDNGSIKLNAEKNAEGSVITVSDKGVGIPIESIPYIFDRFYRVDESRTKATGGSGLGLAIVKHIVQSHNGTITAESKPNEGTVFSIYLPRKIDLT